jgi:hypothetical protein
MGVGFYIRDTQMSGIILLKWQYPNSNGNWLPFVVTVRVFGSGW